MHRYISPNESIIIRFEIYEVKYNDKVYLIMVKNSRDNIKYDIKTQYHKNIPQMAYDKPFNFHNEIFLKYFKGTLSWNLNVQWSW